MTINRSGNKKGTTFKTIGATVVTANQMRSSACKTVRTLIQLMRKLDKMSEEPNDYEPPFFKSCSEQEANNQWTKIPLKMDVGDVNSKHLMLALKVKSILDPCGDKSDNLQGEGMVNLIGESVERDDSLDTDMEVNHSSQDHFVVTPVGKEHSSGVKDMVHEDETEDEVEDERQLALVKNWIISHHDASVEFTNVLSNFPDISMTLTEEIMAKLVNEGVISRVGGDTYAIRKIEDVESHLRDVKEETDAQETLNFKMMKKTGRLHVHESFVSCTSDGLCNCTKSKQATEGKLIDQMAQDGYLEGKSTRRLGKRVVHSDLTVKKLLEVQISLENNSADMEIEEPHNRPSGLDHFRKGRNDRDTSTCGGLDSIGSDFTRTQGKSHIQRNDSIRSDQTKGMKQEQGHTPNNKREPAPTGESIVPGNERTYSDGGNTRCSTQDKRASKASMVKEPILHHFNML